MTGFKNVLQIAHFKQTCKEWKYYSDPETRFPMPFILKLSK